MVEIPPVVPPLPVEKPFVKHYSPGVVVDWLRAGWRDLWNTPGPSLAYGVLVFVLSLIVVASLVYLKYDYILFPVTAGFLVYAPALAIGLYEKSRLIENDEDVTLGAMIANHARAGGQVFFLGLMLLGVMLLWNRAAVIVSGLYFGIRPFPGIDNVVPFLFGDPLGVSMLIVGTLIGGLFAAFSFAISVFSFPMLLDQQVDAMTAMGRSWQRVIYNLPVMLAWAVAVLVLFLLSVATGFLGLIIVFPWLGHATWHVYRAFR